MVGRLYPSWEELAQQNNPLTEGEKALLNYLDTNLPKDPKWQLGQSLANYNGWIIFAQPYLNGTRPDIIIFNPYVGVVIYEVKDWNLVHYQYDDNEQLVVSDRNGKYRIKNPIDQVQYYKQKLVGQLVPKIGEEIDKNEKKYGLIKTALYFHNATADNVEHFFRARTSLSKAFPLLGYDSLNPANIQSVVLGVSRYKSKYWDQTWNEDIIFWLKPPFHSIEQGKPLRLKAGQVQIATPQSGHYRVKGVAGSGKTQALAYRAASIASKGLHVLVVSFNITLWHFIKDMIARAPFSFHWGQITFNHFHGFCSDILNQYGVKCPIQPSPTDFSSKEEYEKALKNYFKIAVSNEVIKTINEQNQKQEKQEATFRYDAILIDEGQDFQVEWYEMLTEHFLGKRDEILIVCDKRQNIYERELDWLDKRGTNKAILNKFKSDFTRLTDTYRLPPKVVKLSNEFSEVYGLDQELKVSKVLQDTELFPLEHIVWINIDEVDWEYFLWTSFQRLKREGQSPSDMVFLLPNHEFGERAVQHFKEYGIEINHVFDEHGKSSRYNKKSFWMGDPRVKMSTIHSFKGWELVNVVLLISPTAGDIHQLDAIVYTAITRTRQNLIILNCHSRYASFGQKLPKRWHEQDEI